MEEREEMNDPHEIIITIRKDSKSTRVVQFSDLYALRTEIEKMIYLWNTNCYYVDVVNRTFIINGGRKMQIEKMGECKILYRRRTQFEKGIDSDDSEPKNKKINWILGIEEIETKKVVFVQISEDGKNWSWEDKL